MRLAVGLGSLIATLAVAALAEVVAAETLAPEDLEDRYGIRVDLKHYPQDEPQQAIRSIVDATRCGDIGYMLAHLISPAQVDEKLGGDQQKLRQLVAKATPEKSKKMVAALSTHLNRGKWLIDEDLAWSQWAGLPHVSLERIGERWFMHNTPVPLPRQP